ncbi:MAG: UDP-3-O-(3-hydroxymyristoyl)glucosamine N-acyltransferase [Candidatus Zixiibacteriota bacterium]
MKNPRTNRVELTTGELAQKIGAKIVGDESVLIRGAAPIESAGPDEITFVANKLYSKFLADTKAGAVILDNDTPGPGKSILRHPHPYLGFAQAIDILYPPEAETRGGVHAASVVDKGSEVDETAQIGPFCHIETGSTIAGNSRLISSIYIGKNVSVGNNCLIYPGGMIMDNSRIGNNVIIHSSTVIGSDGFGFIPTGEGIKKIKQIGWVEIGNDVEIGSNVSVDRGALGPTRIGDGTKIDNLVQIAHNVQIGKNCLIVAQVGISGSTKLGNNVVLAGQVGLTGHIEIGDGVVVAAQSGVSKSIPAGKTFFGYPAREIMETKRIEAALSRLPELLKRVRELEKKLKIESGD